MDQVFNSDYTTLADHMTTPIWRKNLLKAIQEARPREAETLALHLLPSALVYHPEFAGEIVEQVAADLPDKTVEALQAGIQTSFTELHTQTTDDPLYEQSRLLALCRDVEKRARVKGGKKGKGKSKGKARKSSALPYSKENRALLAYLDGQMAAAQQDYGEAMRAYESAARTLNPLPEALAAPLLESLHTVVHKTDDEEAELVKRTLESMEGHLDDDLLTALGNACLDLAEYDEAETILRQVVERQPTPAAWTHLADVYAALDRPEEALEACEKALAMDADYAEGHDAKGGILSLLYRYDEAVAAHERAIELEGDNVSYWFRLAEAAHGGGDYEKAGAAYAKCRELNPDQALMYHDYEGDVYTAMGDYEKAVESYEAAVNINQQYVASYNGLGIVHRLRGDLDKAETAFQHVIRLSPDHPAAYAGLAAIHRERGNTDTFEQNIKLSRRYIQDDASYDLACLASIQGNADAAMELLADVDDPRWKHRARWHPDFNAIRDDSRFQEWVTVD